MKFKCVIFDCDGVLVDSESISAKVFQEMAQELGFKMDFETAVEQFAGTSMNDNLKFVADNIEGSLPEDFEKEFRKRTYKAFKTDIKPVAGVHDLIEKLQVPFCVASSGPVEKIRLNLQVTGLLDKFDERIFSCYEIKSWKPEPDIYLHAAKTMGFSPNECVVIEDSASGIKAGIAGGFRVFALTTENKLELFENLGAVPFQHMSELAKLLNL